jgi:hypothetical protein
MTRLPIHPLLVSLVPVLSMYAGVAGRTDPVEALRSCAAAVMAAAVLFAAAHIVYRNARKAALFTSAGLVIYIGVGAVYPSIEDWQVGDIGLFRRRYFVPVVYFAVAAIAVAMFRLRRPLGTATAFVNLLAFGALLPPAASLANVQLTAVRQGTRTPALPPLVAVTPPAARPDIYYIVFDRYGGRETLRTWGLDNEPTYRYLAEKGFYIAEQSRTNYIKTVLSLAASMNLDYLDDLQRAYGSESQNWAPIYDRVRNNRINAFLGAQGYERFHLGSWYWPTRENPHANHNINYYTAVPLPLTMLLNDNVLFEPLGRMIESPLVNHRRQQWHRVLRQVDDVIELAGRRGPKFVFLHVLVPHDPYVFDRDGSYVSAEVENRRDRNENYLNQVHFANRLIHRLVDGILERSSIPPVILIQGDEGPYPRGTGGDYYDWRQATAPILRQRAGILNAYYLPGGHGRALYPEISPVNSFRVVFNEYLGTRLPLLPDRTLRHRSNVQPLAFDDVTGIVTAPEGRPLSARLESSPPR